MRRSLLFAAVALAALPSLSARAHIGSHEVRVRNNYFDPQQLRIDVGETVTWRVIEGGHTVTAEDGRFDFHSNRLLNQGEAVQHTFTENETLYYHCKVHRGNMFGVIIVGTGSTPPPPSDDPPEIRSVPSAFPTIPAALEDAPAGTRIELASGLYHESVRVTTPGVEIVGIGSGPGAVSIEGASSRGIGISIQADGVTIRNLSVRKHTFAGIVALGAARVTIQDVRAELNDRFGIRAEGVRGLTIRDSYASGHDTAGFSVDACEGCDGLLERVTAQRNLAGFSGVNASGLVVRDSTFTDNATGIALRSVPLRDTTIQLDAPQRGAHIYGNTIADNTNASVKPPPLSGQLDIPTGTGVWLDGSRLDVVEANTIKGHRFGIAVTGILGPSFSHRLVANTIASSTEADLAWDGVGADVCFTGNAGPGGGEPTSQPPHIQTLYDCALPVSAGLPWPSVTLALLSGGA